jgi:DNA invertase Pin-like site-specific DNA recombinase
VRIGYARVSRREQNLDLQIRALKAAGCTRIFTDKISALADALPKREAAIKAINSGDQLVVWKLDRFSRDLLDQLLALRDLNLRGGSLLTLTEAIDTADWMSSIMSRQYAIYAEVELCRIRERTRAGLAAARARGVRLGKQRKITDAQIAEAKRQLDGGMKAEAVAAHHGISRATLYRHMRLAA